MRMIDLGLWEAYRIETPDGQGVAKYRNAAGYDWYSTVAHNPNRPKGVTAVLDPAGNVIVAYPDVYQADPRLGRPVVLEGFEGAPQDLSFKVIDLVAGTIRDVIPHVIARHHALLALLELGIVEAQVNLQIANIADEITREKTRIRFNQPVWHRSSELMTWGSSVFGLSETQVDELFVAANALAA